MAKISLDTSDYERGLDAAGGKMDGFVSKIGSVISGAGKVAAAGATAAAAGVGAIMKQSVDEFADYEQLIGGVETLFKDSAGKLQGYADQAYKTAGLSANAYMETATSFAATLVQSLGGDTEQAADMANMAITDMSDNANKMGTDMTLIQNAYQGFAKGNYTMLDNLKLGYGGTAREMARLINESGVLGDAMQINLDDTQNLGKALQEVGFDKMIEAIHAVQEEMGITGTTFLEAERTISGSVASMKAAWTNWLTGLGREDADMGALTDQLVKSFGTVVDNVVPVIGRIGESLVGVFEDVTGIDVGPVLVKFETLKNGLEKAFRGFSIGDIEGGVFEVFETIDRLTGIDLTPFAGSVATAAENIIGSVQRISEGFREGDLKGGVDAVLGEIERFTGLDLSGFRENVGGVIDGVSESIGNLYTAFADGGLQGLFNGLIEEFEKVTGLDLSPFLDGVSSFVTSIAGSFKNGFEGFAGAFSGFVGSFQEEGWLGIFQGFVDGFGELIDWVGSVAGSAVEGVFTVVQSFLTELKESDYAAKVKGVADEIGKLFTAVKDLGEGVGEKLQQINDEFKETFGMSIGEGIGKFIANAAEALTGVFGAAVESVKTSVEGLIVLINGDLASALNKITGSTGEFIAGAVGSVGEAFGVDKDVSYVAEEAIKEFNKQYGFMPGMLIGNGITTGAVKYSESALGTHGAISADTLAAFSGGGGTYNFRIDLDSRTIADATYNDLKEIEDQMGAF